MVLFVSVAPKLQNFKLFLLYVLWTINFIKCLLKKQNLFVQSALKIGPLHVCVRYELIESENGAEVCPLGLNLFDALSMTQVLTGLRTVHHQLVFW